MEHFFPLNSGEDKKKSLHQKFPRIEEETCAHMHTGVKLLEGMQMKTIMGYSQIIGVDISPLGFGTPGCVEVKCFHRLQN